MANSKKNISIGYGLCCISLVLKKHGVGYRRFSHSNFSKLPRAKAVDKLSQICLHNAETLLRHIEFCALNSISRYRMPSDIFPLLTHPKLKISLDGLKNFPEIKKTLKRCGKAAKSGKVGLSTHPSQFIVLASEKCGVARAAAADINLNALILDLIGAPKSPEAPINLHIARNPKSAKNFKSDFMRGLKMLSKSARARITFENEDRGFWNLKNLVDFLKSAELDKSFGKRIPVVLDFHHNRINPPGISEKSAFFAAAATWGKLAPVCHYSESAKSNRPAAHSDFCKNHPPYFGVPYICMPEAKSKDLAIFKLNGLSAGKIKKAGCASAAGAIIESFSIKIPKSPDQPAR